MLRRLGNRQRAPAAASGQNGREARQLVPVGIEIFGRGA
jgi:hypothetical protein